MARHQLGMNDQKQLSHLLFINSLIWDQTGFDKFLWQDSNTIFESVWGCRATSRMLILCCYWWNLNCRIMSGVLCCAAICQCQLGEHFIKELNLLSARVTSFLCGGYVWNVNHVEDICVLCGNNILNKWGLALDKRTRSLVFVQINSFWE